MPLKKKKAGKKKKGGKKAAAKAAAAAEAAVMLMICRKFSKTYQSRCSSAGSVASTRILRDIRTSIENERPLPKFILDVQERHRTKGKSGKGKNEKGVRKKANDSSVTAGSEEDEKGKKHISDPVVLVEPQLDQAAVEPQLEPLVKTLIHLNYRCLRCLHVWNLPQSDKAVVSLAQFLESPLGPNLKVLEMRDCKLSVWAVGRLSGGLRSSQLALLNLDYNESLGLTVADLCRSLQSCNTLHSLSLNYCHLDSSTAEPLGALVAASQIKHLSLVGNNLHSEGASELVRSLLAVSEGSSSEKLVISPLMRLHLQDNGIDILGEKGTGAIFLFTRLLKRWLLSSDSVEELNLGGNWIGEEGGREVLSALQARKEAGLPAVKVMVTHRMSSDIFASIVEFGKAGKKKGGKKRGGKRKKK